MRARHPLHIDVRTNVDMDSGIPLVIARVTVLGASAVTLRVQAWASNSANGYILYCDLLKIIKKAFDSEGIEIPFPQRSVTMIHSEKESNENNLSA